MSALEFLRQSSTAESLFVVRDYAAAATAYSRVTEAYPWTGEAWRRLGLSLMNLGRHREAAHAFTKADGMGTLPYPQNVAWNAAHEFILAGERDSALTWLRRAAITYRHERLPALQGDSAFLSLRDDPRFKEILQLTSGLPEERTAGWRHDVNFLVGELRRMNAAYVGRPLPDSISRAAERLLDDIPSLSDAAVVVRMQQLLAMLGQSHNSIYFPGLDSDARVRFTTLPLTFYPFSDGLFIVDATPAHADLIGARVTKFDGTTVDGALAAVRTLAAIDQSPLATAPSAWWPGEPSMGQLATPEVLHALGVTRDPARVALSVVDRSGRSREVSPMPGSFSRPRKMQPPRVPDIGPAPLYLSRPNDTFWFAALPLPGALYVQVNQISNKAGGETLAAFGRRLRRVLDSASTRDLIIDVRRNNGGNTYLYTELLRTLVRFDADTGHRLVVLAGRYTYSAAMNFITEIDRLTNAVFAGEPSGGAPVQLGGDESQTILPYSRINGGLSSRMWQLTSPGDSRHWIAPELPVPLSSADYFANRDPVLDAVLTYLEAARR